jgi:putative PIN family toxin of toxin-antitoxin system
VSLNVVFDNSTLVSAAIRPNSVPDQALQFALGVHTLYASEKTIAELHEVLQRKKLDSYAKHDERMEFFEVIRIRALRIVVTHTDYESVSGVCRDGKDEMFLALCLAADADILVTSDRDLLVLHPWNGIPILTPAEFLAQAESSAPEGGEFL